MQYIDEYRDKALLAKALALIKPLNGRIYRLMEVCGGHTMALHRFAIPEMLPDCIKLLSGPGCPVCVTGIEFIDKLVAYSRTDKVILTTFADLLRVPGSFSRLEFEKASGRDIRTILSPLDAIKIAMDNRSKLIVFPAIGFETTAPGTAVAILKAKELGLKNFFVCSSHKIMPPAMKAVLEGQNQIDGFLAPGHVSTITGSEMYNFIASEYGKPVVISGFEPLDLLQSIAILVNMLNNGHPEVVIQYNRAVKPLGNTKAQFVMDQVFQLTDETWRGLGVLKNSGLKLQDRFSEFDANIMIQVTVPPPIEPKGCICGNILKGISNPSDCSLFSHSCRPSTPVGACMVSAEGTCHAHYLYKKSL